jgi:hypothetical protein
VCDAEAFGSGCGAASGDEAFALALQAADAADDAAEDAAGAAAAAALVMSCMFEEFANLHGERVAGKATVAKATELQLALLVRGTCRRAAPRAGVLGLVGCVGVA